MTHDDLQAQAQIRHLTILGGFHPEPADKTPEDSQTLLLLGPDAQGFWAAFTASAEWRDGKPDPVDRWSRRVIGAWAKEVGAQAVYPFGGPPFQPFFSWATRTGRIHASPIRLLVHDTAGLMVSFRGALALPFRLSLPQAAPSPCTSCTTKPCVTACPVDAFDGTGYGVPACKDFLVSVPGQDCMTKGCAARRACPVSNSYQRPHEQSAYHMTTFKG